MNCPYCGFVFKALLMNADTVPDVAPLVCEGCVEVSLLIDRCPYRTTPEQLLALKKSPAWRDMILPAQQIIRRNLTDTTAVSPEQADARAWARRVVDQARKALAITPVDRSRQTLTDGSPVTPDHRDIDPRTGQQKGYIVLSAEERAKGFVRPVRRTYRHVGAMGIGPKNLRELTMDEQVRHAGSNYVKFEEYPEIEAPKTGRFWTQEQLDRTHPKFGSRGCGGETTMGLALAETYSRDPGFYSGTFCVFCKQHFPLDEFVWQGTSERVGS